ncbi:MAG TPA: tetratricopeptide repeat protein [Spirochaetia bacterium]|nr:tetratricopeptide repeat protein [Spirochaetia bacterium]
MASGIVCPGCLRYVSSRMRALAIVVVLAAPVSLWASPPAVELYNEAESRFLGGNFTSALVGYNEFLQFYPSSDLTADVQYRRAVCLYELGNYQQASDLLSDIALRYRWTRYIGAVPLWQGLCLYRLSRYTPSLVSLNEYLATGKDPLLVPRALLAKSLDLEALQKLPEAADAARQVVSGYPRSEVVAPALVLLSSLLREEKSYDALEQLAAATDTETLPAGLRQEFLWNRAEGLWASDRQADAVTIYLELRDARSDISLAAYRRLFAAAQSQNDHARMEALGREMESHFAGTPQVMLDIWAALGVQSYKARDLTAAWMYLQRAWALRKSFTVDSSVPIYLAKILQDRKDTEGARSLLQDYAAKPGASSESAMLALGVFARDSGELPVADSILTRFLQAYPKAGTTQQAAAILADVELREGKIDQSAALVSQHLQEATGEARASFLRLQAEIARERKDFTVAAGALKDYLQLAPEDVDARVDLLEVQFLGKDYASIPPGAAAVLAAAPDLASKNPRAWILVSYLLGLSQVAMKDYSRAAATLGSIDPDAAARNDLGVIVPYLRYYLGWSYSKTGDFKTSARILDALIAAYPRHALAPKILFLAGWSHYNLGDFDLAANDFFQAGQAEGDHSSSDKDFYLYAKSLIGGKKLADASAALQHIIDSSPQSPFADSALFDYAGMQAVSDSPSGAIESYRTLTSRFPSSPLAEDSAYRIAETLFSQRKYGDAAMAFTEYRRKYPAGRLYDAALYWGGEAAYATGAKFDAALLWEQLANSYRTSSFRAAAMRKAAEVYQSADDPRRALDLYSRFLSDYPDEARLAKADIAVEQLRYRIQGLDAAEADLATRVSHSSGAARLQAMTDLARLYIYSGESKVEQGYQMLQKVASEGSGITAAKAVYLEGEYFYRKSDLMEAAKRFVSAAATGAADADFSASSLYRAAEMMKLGERPDQVDALVKKMTDAYPSSPWTARARRLQEAAK